MVVKKCPRSNECEAKNELESRVAKRTAALTKAPV